MALERVPRTAKWLALPAAEKVLGRADHFATGTLSAFDRDHIRSVIKSDGPYGTQDRRFYGTITRLWKPIEGQLDLHEKGVSLFFRAAPDLGGKLRIGDKVSFVVGIRIRGLRALRVEQEGDGQADLEV